MNKDKETIGILTLHYNFKNYGCVLQAYSTYHYLKSCGYKAEIIDQRYPGKLAAIGTVNTRSQLELQRFIESMPLSRSFIDQDIHEVESYIRDRYGLVIYGSDEIWKWRLEKDGSQRHVSYDIPVPNVYWPIGLNVPHIAYAATIGQSNTGLTQNIIDHFSQSLKEFDRIGARDVRTAKVVKKISGVHSDIVPDPAYLSDFTSECDPDLIRHKLEKAGANFDKQVVGVYSPFKISLDGSAENLSEVNLSNAELTPIEFWYAPKLLSCMVTNSHHGVIVSMIHNTPCVVATMHPPKVKDHVVKYRLPVGTSIMNAIKNWDHDHISRVVEQERAATRGWLLKQCQKFVPELRAESS